MPLYDCGDPDCAECQRAFGPDRTAAIAAFRAREVSYRLHAEAERDTERAIAQGRAIGHLLDCIFGLSPKKGE